jgi:predicted CoA-substrate-specific enzyme activase
MAIRRKKYSLGIDVGSVSTNLVITDTDGDVVEKLYRSTGGQPIAAITAAMEEMEEMLGQDAEICASGTTGSGRELAGVIAGADIIKNEITAHAVAAQKSVPGVRTIIEIGGQDSKIIIMRNGTVHDFAMNTVCAAGTGSFLDRQAARLGIPISEFGALALKSASPVRIAGRCAVFAESDMIHKQQTGHCTEDIVRGLCEALVRNYMTNLAKGKDIREPVVFQGGVASNIGIAEAFRRALGMTVIIPEHNDVMGAYGAAIMALREYQRQNGFVTNFRGFSGLRGNYNAKSRECNGCGNACELIEIFFNGSRIAGWGDRCGKWKFGADRLKEKVKLKEKYIVNGWGI